MPRLSDTQNVEQQLNFSACAKRVPTHLWGGGKLQHRRKCRQSLATLLLSGLAVVATKVIATETLPVHSLCFICTPAALPSLGMVQPLPWTCWGVGQEEAKPILPSQALLSALHGAGTRRGMEWERGWEKEQGQGWEWGQSCPSCSCCCPKQLHGGVHSSDGINIIEYRQRGVAGRK